MRRLAQDALNDYMKNLAETPEYQAGLKEIMLGRVVWDEIDRVSGEMIWTPDEFPQPVDPYGDRVWGPITPVYDTATGNKIRVFKLEFIEIHQFNDEGFGVDHVLNIGGTGSVWLGECNNSARIDISDKRRAWAAWCARRVLTHGLDYQS